MTLPYFTSMVDVTQYLVDLVTANQDDLGLLTVYYGAQEIIPKFPSAELESIFKSRTLYATHQYELIFRVGILVLIEPITTSTEKRKEAEQFGEAVQDVIDADRKFGGKLINSFITRIEPGRVLRANRPMMRAVQLTWEGLSREEF